MNETGTVWIMRLPYAMQRRVLTLGLLHSGCRFIHWALHKYEWLAMNF